MVAPLRGKGFSYFPWRLGGKTIRVIRVIGGKKPSFYYVFYSENVLYPRIK
jgi:hypothetical protein